MNKIEHADPFDVFDDDDDDEEGDDGQQLTAANKRNMEIACSLVKAANERIPLPLNGSEHERKAALSEEIDLHQEQLVDLTYLKALELQWPEPMFRGEIILVSSLPFGGGRGYVAKKTIPPGSLILVESPVMKWPEDQLGKKLGIVSIKHLLELPNASRLVKDLEDFHPTKEKVDSNAAQEEDSR